MSLTHHEVSDRQVAANQGNAQKSTGPKTAKGKARVALNAIKHGAYAGSSFVNREYAEITSDQRHPCYAPSDDALARLGPHGQGRPCRMQK